jgi:hypothetical protein
MRAFAHNLESARHRARCEEGLEAGFNDDDASVRKEAAGAIQRLTSEKVAPSAALIERFLESQAFEEHVEAVMLALEDAAAVPSALSLKACERVLDMLISPDAEIRRAGQVAREVSDVLIRAYVDSADDVERGRALDVIDRSLELNAYGAQRTERIRPQLAKTAGPAGNSSEGPKDPMGFMRRLDLGRTRRPPTSPAEHPTRLRIALPPRERDR